MKGDVAADTIGVIAMAAITLFLFFTILPEVVKTMWKEVAANSPDYVSRVLAGQVTISGAAPHSMEIRYSPSKLSYDVSIEDRVLKVEVSEGQMKIYEDVGGKSTIAVDATASLSKVNYFIITKSPEEYEVRGVWVEKD